MIGPKKPREAKEYISTYDIETGSTGDLLDIGFYHNGEYRLFSDWHSFIGFLANRMCELSIASIWSHNGGGFDNVALVVRLLHDPTLKPFIAAPPQIRLINGQILELEILLAGNDYPVRFRDSFRLLPMPLDKILKTFFGQGKDDVPEHYKSRMELYKQAYPDAYYRYLKRDVIGLHDALTKFRDLINDRIAAVGDLPLSLGSLALSVFRTEFLSDSIETPDANESHFTARAYSGGRTEYFGNGITNQYGYYENCYYYDINSMYPSQMAVNEFPITKGRWTRKLRLDAHGKTVPGCYEIRYKQTGGRIPLLKPEIDNGDGTYSKAKEASFEGRGVYTHFEIDYLRAIGAKIDVIKGVYYPQVAPIFRQFVSTLYNLRLECRESGNASLDLAAKLLMNNLYGKFGQREQAEKIVICSPDHAQEIAKLNRVLSIRPMTELDGDDLPYAVNERIRVPHRFPAIAAMITAASRVQLTHFAEWYADSVLYCDTDSLILQREMDAEYIDANKLGYFKKECGPVTMQIWGRKGYRIIEENKIKQKGIPQSAIPDDLFTHLQRGTYRAEYKRPTLLKSAIRTGNKNPSEFVPLFRTISMDKSSREKGLLRT